MQFAVFEVRKGQPILIDAVELAALKNRLPVADEPADEAAFIWHVAYGCFMPQPSRDPEKAAAELREYQGAAFGRITDEGTCRLSEVRAVELFPAAHVGQAVQFPCAVLIGTTETIPPPRAARSLALFPRFIEQMTPLDNTLNRPGVLALKGETKRAAEALNPDPAAVDWRTFIEPTRVLPHAADRKAHARRFRPTPPDDPLWGLLEKPTA